MKLLSDIMICLAPILGYGLLCAIILLGIKEDDVNVLSGYKEDGK